LGKKEKKKLFFPFLLTHVISPRCTMQPKEKESSQWFDM